MKRSKSAIALIAAVATMATSLVGCKSSTTASSSPAASAGTSSGTLAYKGEISLMHFSTSEESQGNGGSDGFRTMISQWQSAHPDIKLKQTVVANADYKTQIATQAAAGDLPDVFLLQGMNTKEWAKQGLILDMTDIIKQSPYYSNYNTGYFTPFTDKSKLYGLPALTGGTCTVVMYDKAAWKKAGFSSFPTTWNDVKKADKYFKSNGYKETVAFGNGGKWQINSDFLAVTGDRFTGPKWFQSMIDKSGAKFTDAEFIKALTFTRDLFKSGIFNNNFNSITNEDAREYYISGETPSYIGGNWDVSYIQATLKSNKNEKLYNNTGFAVLPQPDGATGDQNSQNIGLGYAVSLNSKVATDKDKLAAAVNFAEYVTGPDFANYVVKKYALGGLTKVENVDLSKFDQFTKDFYNYSYVSTKACEIYDSYINSAVWDVMNTELQSMLNSKVTPEEVAQKAQKAYESNY